MFAPLCWTSVDVPRRRLWNLLGGSSIAASRGCKCSVESPVEKPLLPPPKSSGPPLVLRACGRGGGRGVGGCGAVCGVRVVRVSLLLLFSPSCPLSPSLLCLSRCPLLVLSAAVRAAV